MTPPTMSDEFATAFRARLLTHVADSAPEVRHVGIGATASQDRTGNSDPERGAPRRQRRRDALRDRLLAGTERIRPVGTGRVLISVGLALILVTGVVGAVAATILNAWSPVLGPPPTVIDASCVPVASGPRAALQRGLDDMRPGTRIVGIASSATSAGDTWFVVASFESDSFGDGKGVWLTRQNPANSTSAEFLSLDPVAQTVSSFEPPLNSSKTMSGAQESLDCLPGGNHVATGSSRVMTPAPAGSGDTPLTPLEPGEARQLAPDSMWSVGAEFRTSHVDRWVTLYLRLEIDWDLAAASGVDVVNDGADPWQSLTFDYLTDIGTSYAATPSFDHLPTGASEPYTLGVIHPPTDTVRANLEVVMPTDQFTSGTWRVSDAQGNVVFISGG